VKNLTRRQRARTLLQWVFSRGNSLVTCELHQDGSRYLVRLLTHGDLGKALVATFDAGLAAFQRHAAIAAELRRSGWMLVAYK
jgi:hypothetical protein